MRPIHGVHPDRPIRRIVSPRVTRSAMTSGCIAAAFALLAAGSACAVSPLAWPQWGGPNRDFKSPAERISDHWPDGGPRTLWRRPLGSGYSSIVTDGTRLFTLYRRDTQEVVVALDARTGNTLWEYAYDAPTHDGFEDRLGKGPNATPLLHADRLYTVGIAGVVNCLDKQTGKLVWTKIPARDFAPDAPKARFGCSSSPILYRNSLITFIGGTGCGLVALDLDDGACLWKRHDFVDTYSSPILINVDGQDQIALLTNHEVVGVDPGNGDLLWTHPHQNQWKTNICTPVWIPGHRLYISSSGDAGSRLLELSRKGGHTDVREIWATRKMSVGQGTAIRIANRIYGTAGSESANFIAALDLDTGKLQWRQRGFAKATMIHADGKFIILDEDGWLALAAPNPTGLDVLAKTRLFENRAWTLPTLSGTTLYVRDQTHILAVDLQ